MTDSPRRGSFEVQQDPTANDAVSNSGERSGDPAILILRREVGIGFDIARCRSSAYWCQRDDEDRGKSQS